MSFRKSRKNDDKEDKRALLLHSMEIDDNDDNNNDDDYYSQSSSSNDSYEDVDNDYAFNSSLYRWTCRTIIVFGLILIPLSWGYSYFDHRRSRDDDDDDLMTKLNSLPYQWEPDGPYDKCNPGDYFTQIMEKTLSMTTNPDSPELCDILKKKKCLCENPTIPKPRTNKADEWNATFERTKEVAANASKEFKRDDLQVVLLGDSITEHWAGTLRGEFREEYEDHARVFRKLFTKKAGGKINGVAIGIGADTVAQLLYRNQNGGIGDLRPSVFWVLIGTNDLGRDGCSVESVVAGNIAVVEDLKRRRPDTVAIVLNSLLPRNEIFMPRISKVNERLQCYADTTPGVEFFNASSIFWDPVNGTLRGLPDQLHPDAESSMVWGTAIVQKVQDVIRGSNRRHASQHDTVKSSGHDRI